MSGFFSDLAERAIGVASTPMPAVAPLYSVAVARDGERGFVEDYGEARAMSRGAASVSKPAAPAARASSDAPPARPAANAVARRLAAVAPVARADSPMSPAIPVQPIEARPRREPAASDAGPEPGTRGDHDGDADVATSAVDRPARDEREVEPRLSDVGRAAEVISTAPPAGALPRAEPARHDSGLAAVLARIEALTANSRGETETASPPPVVRISIGRIEVRAAPTPMPSAPPRAVQPAAAGPTLAEFLAKRSRTSP